MNSLFSPWREKRGRCRLGPWLLAGPQTFVGGALAAGLWWDLETVLVTEVACREGEPLRGTWDHSAGGCLPGREEGVQTLRWWRLICYSFGSRLDLLSLRV